MLLSACRKTCFSQAEWLPRKEAEWRFLRPEAVQKYREREKKRQINKTLHVLKGVASFLQPLFRRNTGILTLLLIFVYGSATYRQSKNRSFERFFYYQDYSQSSQSQSQSTSNSRSSLHLGQQMLPSSRISLSTQITSPQLGHSTS